MYEERVWENTDRNGKVLKQVENFRYLGSVFHARGGREEDVKVRISAAWKSGVNCQACCVINGCLLQSKGRSIKQWWDQWWFMEQKHGSWEEVKKGFLKELKWERCDGCLNSRWRTGKEIITFGMPLESPALQTRYVCQDWEVRTCPATSRWPLHQSYPNLCNSNKTKIVWILPFCSIKVMIIGISRNELLIFIIVLPIPMPILISKKYCNTLAILPIPIQYSGWPLSSHDQIPWLFQTLHGNILLTIDPPDRSVM